ncbi:MAG: hypothetical protein IT480_07055 [Gammaproteobacteria bacterium]|nr:hypothetical protein [Gammaproteobacteria bacterium]
MSREELVEIAGPHGLLPGIVHWPDGSTQPRCCVVMLSAGQLGRAGPQRLYVNAARQWTAAGFICLRLDLAGVGDSPLQNEARHFDGHRAEEARAAVDFADRILGAERVYLQGLCAGARVAFKCAAQDARVSGVLAWSCPTLSASDGWPVSPYENRNVSSAASTRDTLRALLRAAVQLRFLRPGWWRERLRHGGADARQLMRALRGLTAGTGAARNPFLAAVDQLRREGRDFLFVFGQRDTLELGEFRETFPGIAAGATHAQGFHVVPHGTHTFSALESQREVIELSAQWLHQRLHETPVYRT